ncbi:MAG: hypothetical protein C4K49_12895 [Candidatus Thorarchaeota archaeon]|nr:MAG: hypothetical protein C4K49_12895 [Candidatus Thorarchaeota archaeon]
MIVRKMSIDDTDFALSLTSGEGWSDIKSDFESLISYSPAAAFVGEEDGRRIGMISAVSYGNLGFIGSLIVVRDCRNKGHGTNLMKHAIEHLSGLGVKTLMLDAVEAAIPVYRKLGFSTVCRSLRMKGVVEARRTDNVRPMTRRDLPTVLTIDQAHFGADRSHFLKRTWSLFPEFCKTLDIGKSVQGYVMGSPGNDFIRIAPWIVNGGVHRGEDLLRELAAQSGGKALRMGVLERDTTTVELLKTLGFEEVSSSYRMIHGDSSIVGLSQGIHAIGSPAKG